MERTLTGSNTELGSLWKLHLYPADVLSRRRPRQKSESKLLITRWQISKRESSPLDRKERDPIWFLTFPLTFLYASSYTGKRQLLRCRCYFIASARWHFIKPEVSFRIFSSRRVKEFRVLDRRCIVSICINEQLSIILDCCTRHVRSSCSSATKKTCSPRQLHYFWARVSSAHFYLSLLQLRNRLVFLQLAFSRSRLVYL